MNPIKRLKEKLKELKNQDKAFRPTFKLDERGREILELNLETPSSAYSRFSTPESPRIAPEIFDYLYSVQRPGEFVLRIINKELAADPAAKEKFSKTFLYDLRAQNIKQRRKRKIENIKSAILLFSGASVITLYYLVQTLFENFFTEPLLILSWVLIWEAFDGFIFTNLTLRRQQLRTARLRLAEITFAAE